MSSKGLRLQLLARLSKVLKQEQEAAENVEKNNPKILAEKEKDKEEEKKLKQVSRDKWRSFIYLKMIK